nr:MAG TPA: hypothetical protein [Caudoviricetes sp.]
MTPEKRKGWGVFMNEYDEISQISEYLRLDSKRYDSSSDGE